MLGLRLSLRRLFKTTANGVSLVLVSPAALATWFEARLARDSEAVFNFWSQVFALAPGLPGLFLRRAFYHCTLESCSLNCHVGFGAIFTHRRVVVEEDVYIGPYALVGCAALRRGALLGSRVSVLSGPSLHTVDERGRWRPADMTRAVAVEIGEYAWIGEGAIVMVNVGAGSLVGAGAVVSTRVRPMVVVAGNPARFVRRLYGESEEASS